MNRVLLIPTVLLLLIGALCLWLTAGHDPAATLADGQKPIVLCNADDIKTLDPGQMSWANDIRAAMALWEGLTAYDPVTLKPVPGMAESWDVSPDNKVYTFHLRKGAKWSNGDPVTSADFLFAWRRTITPVTGADYAGLFKIIVGAEEFTNSEKPGDFDSVGIKAPDPLTFVVTLKSPCSYFLDLCAFPPMFPLNEKAMRPFQLDPHGPGKGYDGRWTRPPHLVTNGPYILEEWKFKQYLSLVPNPNYWDRKNVRCDRLIIKGIKDARAALLSYQAGAVDILTFIPSQFGDDLIAARDAGKRTDIHYRPVFGSYYYIVNCTKHPLDDPRVRKALALSIDKTRIVHDVTHMNEKTLGLIVPPDSIPGYISPDPLPMNIPEAQKLLADAGYPEGKGFPSIQILTNNDAASHAMIAQAIGQMWQQNLGIQVTYYSVERATFGDLKRNQNFNIARGGWYGDYVDPTTWLDLLRSTDGNNDGKYNNPAYDALLTQASTEPDAAKRFDLLKQAEAIIVHEDFPLIPLYQYGDGLIFNADKIKGIDANVRLLTPLKWIYRAP